MKALAVVREDGDVAGRVFILGAGFSKAVHASMPALAELSDAVLDRLRALGLPMPPGYSSPVTGDFERWLSFLVDAPPWLDAGGRGRNHASFDDIAQAVAVVIGERQLAAASQPRPPWLGELVEYWQRMNSTVLTFNYDAMVELAWLESFGDSHRPWSDLYTVPLTPAASRRGTVLGGSTPATGLRLLKLHGSLNWYYSGPGSPPGDVVYDLGITGGWSVDGLAGRYEAFDVEDKVPFIVPPAAVKSPYYVNATLQAQWRQAAAALTVADEVVVMGFGMPPTDLLVSSLLATSTAASARIVPVGPDPGVLTRLRELLEPSTGSMPIGGSRVIDSFVRDSNPIAFWVSRNASKP